MPDYRCNMLLAWRERDGARKFICVIALRQRRGGLRGLGACARSKRAAGVAGRADAIVTSVNFARRRRRLMLFSVLRGSLSTTCAVAYKDGLSASCSARSLFSAAGRYLGIRVLA